MKRLLDKRITALEGQRRGQGAYIVPARNDEEYRTKVSDAIASGRAPGDAFFLQYDLAPGEPSGPVDYVDGLATIKHEERVRLFEREGVLD